MIFCGISFVSHNFECRLSFENFTNSLEILIREINRLYEKFATEKPYSSNLMETCLSTFSDSSSNFVDISSADILFVIIASAIADFTFITKMPL